MTTQTLTLDFLTLSAPLNWSAKCERVRHDRTISFMWGDYTAGALTVIGQKLPRRGSNRKIKPDQELAAYVEQQYAGRLCEAIGEVVSNQRDGGLILRADFRVFDAVAEIGGLLRAWRVVSKRHLAYAFYLSEDWHESRLAREKELAECEAVIESIAFVH